VTLVTIAPAVASPDAYIRMMAARRRKPVAEAVAKTARAARGESMAAAEPREARRPRPRRGRPSDVFGGELRRRDVFPLLVLHLIASEPAYGNRLIEEIEEMTQGVISVNPNTMYPLLRELEAKKLIEGRWEYPDRRTRRFYEITAAGRKEYQRLREELKPFLDSVIRSVTLIEREIYGG
jgi:PadR family transcriptional regulator, regulatory protein PadR